MKVRDRIRQFFTWLDWKVPASLMGLGIVALVGWAFLTVKQDSGNKDIQIDRLEEQVAELKEQNRILLINQEVGDKQAECRSLASLFTAEQRAIADTLLSRGLSAYAAGVEVGPYKAALDIANDNVDVAIAAQKQAVDQCSVDPDYRIDPNIISPVPLIPGA